MFLRLLSFVPLIWGLNHYFYSAVIPGDLGDARFNMYILEHGFRWLSGQDASFWSAPFFYPATDVVAYSDNLLGSLPIYAIFREFHMNREASFQMWNITVFILNYLASYWVMRRLGVSLWGTMAGSYVFTFGLPVMGQVGHAQLFARFMVPIGIYYWLKFLETRYLKDWSLALVALLWQIYLGIYTGYFLGMAFVLISVCRWYILRPPSLPNAPFLKKLSRVGLEVFLALKNMLSNLKNPTVRPFILALGIFVGGLVPLGIAYGTVEVEMGGRSWGEISSQLPHIASFFRAPQSQVYGSIMNWGQNLPLSGEHMIFVGIIPFLCLVLFPLWIRRRYEDANYLTLKILWLAVVVFSICTLDVCGISLYWFIAHLPGVNAIRGVTRFSLVMLFPVALIMSTMLSHMLEAVHQIISHRIPALGKLIFLVSLGVVSLVVIDQLSDFPSYPKKETFERVQHLKDEIREAMVRQGLNLERIVVWSNPSESQFPFSQIDTMLASQDLGIPTVNGYSGNVPSGYPLDLFFLVKDKKCNALREWVNRHQESFSKKAILVVGDPCSNVK